MDDLVKSLNRIEKYAAKYIFNKYICNSTNTENINKDKDYKRFLEGYNKYSPQNKQDNSQWLDKYK